MEYYFVNIGNFDSDIHLRDLQTFIETDGLDLKYLIHRSNTTTTESSSIIAALGNEASMVKALSETNGKRPYPHSNPISVTQYSGFIGRISNMDNLVSEHEIEQDLRVFLRQGNIELGWFYLLSTEEGSTQTALAEFGDARSLKEAIKKVTGKRVYKNGNKIIVTPASANINASASFSATVNAVSEASSSSRVASSLSEATPATGSAIACTIDATVFEHRLGTLTWMEQIGPLHLTHSKIGRASARFYVFLFPGAGGFGLNFSPEYLYPSLKKEFTTAEVIEIYFNGNFHYEFVRRNIVDQMSANIRALRSDSIVFLVGWSFGGGVVLDLAYNLKDWGIIKGVITVAGQGVSTLGNTSIVGIEELVTSLLFIAGTEDEVFGGKGRAVQIAQQHHARAVRCRDKKLVIVDGGGHDAQPSKDFIHSWIQSRADLAASRGSASVSTHDSL